MKEDFKDYLKNAKNDFKEVIAKYNYNDHKELNIAFDSFLLAYEQAENKAINFTDSSLQFNASFEIDEKVWYNREKCKIININKDTGLFDIQAEDGFIYTGNEADRLTPRSV